jgi:hypothetical protein
LTAYLIALALTIGTEGLVLTGWLRWERVSSDYVSLLIFLTGLNMITHPVAWAAWSFVGIDYGLVELAVIVVEALGLNRMMQIPCHKSLLLSIVLNIASASVGLLLPVG